MDNKQGQESTTTNCGHNPKYRQATPHLINAILGQDGLIAWPKIPEKDISFGALEMPHEAVFATLREGGMD